MIGAATFINPLIKIVVTVAILAAAYFFLVKPVLDTTEKAFETAAPAFQSLDGLGPGIRRSVRSAERIQDEGAKSSGAQLKEASRLLDCVSDARGDVDEIQRCNGRFGPG